MPRELAVVLTGQKNCEITLSRNQNAVDTAGWSFTPLANHYSLQMATILNASSASLSRLDFLVLADDHGVLSSIGAIVSSASALRSLKIQAIVTTPPFAGETLRISRKILLKGLDWLHDPLRRVERRLRLEELELINICICGSECSPLNEMVDTNVLRSLKLSCMQFLLCDGPQFRRLQELRLRFKSGRPTRPSQCTTEWSRMTISTALLRFAGLKVLEIVDRVDVLTAPVLQTLGPYLVTLLAIRRIPPGTYLPVLNNESTAAWVDGYPRSFLESLGNYCPNLAELAVTMPGPTCRVRDCTSETC